MASFLLTPLVLLLSSSEGARVQEVAVELHSDQSSALRYNYSRCSRLFAYLLIFMLRERGRVSGREGQREKRERENLKQAPRSAQSLMPGSMPRPWDHDLS